MKLISSTDQAARYLDSQGLLFTEQSQSDSAEIRSRLLGRLRSKYPTVPSVPLPQGRAWDYVYRYLPEAIWENRDLPDERRPWFLVFESRATACFRVVMGAEEIRALDATDLYLLADDGAIVVQSHDDDGPAYVSPGQGDEPDPTGEKPRNGFEPPLIQTKSDLRAWISQHDLNATIEDSEESLRLRSPVRRRIESVAGLDLTHLSQGQVWDRAWNYIPPQFDVEDEEFDDALRLGAACVFESDSVPAVRLDGPIRSRAVFEGLDAYILNAKGDLLVHPYDRDSEDCMFVPS